MGKSHQQMQTSKGSVSLANAVRKCGKPKFGQLVKLILTETCVPLPAPRAEFHDMCRSTCRDHKPSWCKPLCKLIGYELDELLKWRGFKGSRT